MPKLVLIVMLLLGTVAQAEDKRPTRMWDRKGPLGETPKHVTDAYPLSDQQDKGRWAKFEPMSDEFEAKPMNSGGSSSFWFQVEETPGWFASLGCSTAAVSSLFVGAFLTFPIISSGQWEAVKFRRIL